MSKYVKIEANGETWWVPKSRILAWNIGDDGDNVGGAYTEIWFESGSSIEMVGHHGETIARSFDEDEPKLEALRAALEEGRKSPVAEGFTINRVLEKIEQAESEAGPMPDGLSFGEKA